MVAISDLYPEVIKTCRPLIIEDKVLKALVRKFSDSISRSLRAERPDKAIVKCRLTHVSDFPDGTEKGNFIGLEFSGKIFRLIYVNLKGNRFCTTLSRLYEFPERKPREGVAKVIDYVARCVNNFIETYDICDKKLILGVASSFSMEQDSLQSGRINQWGPDFQFYDLATPDFFIHLKIALRRLKNTRKIYLISLVSSSTATLLSGLYKDPAVRIGVFLGDETNLTYIERFKNIAAHEGDGLRTCTALGVEIRNFGDNGLLNSLKTEFDYDIDAASINPGKLILEKFTSAAYLGEIARLCLYKLASLGVILNGYVTPGLSMKDALKASDMALMEMDEEKKFDRCRMVMRKFGYNKVSDEDCLQIRFVCRTIARRSSNLMAACLTAMIQRMENREVRIVGDGFLLREFPSYMNYLIRKMIQLKKPEVRFCIKTATKEDVAIGAGIIAHIYKDATIKLEDKHRALPFFDKNKYNIKELPSPYIDCECEPQRLPASSSVNVNQVFEYTDPIFANPIETN